MTVIFTVERQHRALEMLLARLDESDGLLDGDADEAEILRFMRLLGGVLFAAGAGSENLADAHVVAVAVEREGAMVSTGDPRDMARLSDPYRTVVIEALPSRCEHQQLLRLWSLGRHDVPHGRRCPTSHMSRGRGNPSPERFGFEVARQRGSHVVMRFGR